VPVVVFRALAVTGAFSGEAWAGASRNRYRDARPSLK
jgi:hypothetical protein